MFLPDIFTPAAYASAILTLAGLVWLAQSILSFSSEEKTPFDDLMTSLDIKEPQAEDLREIGSGAPAEEVLANALRNTTVMIFVVGDMNNSIWQLLKYNVSPEIPMQILTNTDFARFVLHRIMNRFSNCAVRSAGHAESTVTLINVDGKSLFMFDEKDHSVAVADTPQAVNRLTAPCVRDWNAARPYTGET